jgi:hypothetical protein
VALSLFVFELQKQGKQRVAVFIYKQQLCGSSSSFNFRTLRVQNGTESRRKSSIPEDLEKHQLFHEDFQAAFPE